MDGTSIVRRPPFGSNPLVGERGSDTQRKILSAALEVFGEVGFNEARVELITTRAGCSRPAFYQYFSSKDDVFWQLAGQLGSLLLSSRRPLAVPSALRTKTWLAKPSAPRVTSTSIERAAETSNTARPRRRSTSRSCPP